MSSITWGTSQRDRLILIIDVYDFHGIRNKKDNALDATNQKFNIIQATRGNQNRSRK